MIRNIIFVLVALMISVPASAGKIVTLPDGTRLECKTKLAVGDVYLGGYGSGRSSRGSRTSRGYGAYGGSGRGATVSTPWGGGQLGSYRECVVISVPEDPEVELEDTTKGDSERVKELEAEIERRDAVEATALKTADAARVKKLEDELKQAEIDEAEATKLAEESAHLADASAAEAEDAQRERDQAYQREHESRERLERRRAASQARRGQ